MARAALAVAAAAAALGMAAATADCEPMDLANYNVSDYIRWSGTSDRL